MKYLMIVASSLIVGLLLFSCRKSAPTVKVKENIKEGSLALSPIVQRGYGNETDPYTIVSARGDGSSLEIEVEYSGGCAEHSFQLFTDGMLMKSLPPKQFYFLKHEANGDTCEEKISETLTFDMSTIDIAGNKRLVVILSGTSESVELAFD